MLNLKKTTPLEDLDHEELLQTARRLLAEADALSSRISAVNEIGIAINRTLDLQSILRTVGKQVKWLLDFEHCSVCLKENDDWQIKTLFGPDETTVETIELTDNVGKALQTGYPRLIREGTDSPFLSNYQSQIIIPLSADEKVLGTINFAAKEANSYTYDDMRIGYMVSLQLAAAIRNANTFEELQRTQEELHMRVEELDAYGHTIAHDLKSPLSNVLLTSEVFLMKFKDELPPSSERFIRSIQDSSKQMNQMIDQLLWLARLRDAKEAIEPVDTNESVQNALKRFTHATQTANVKVNVTENLPACLGYPQWVEEIFANLISNAVKYMGEDNTEATITITYKDDNEKIRYEVQDNGVGIEPNDQKRLFEMFTRLETTKAEGLGLGLSIVRRIIQKLDGELGVESTYGEGSTFWFTLPAILKEKTDD